MITTVTHQDKTTDYTDQDDALSFLGTLTDQELEQAEVATYCGEDCRANPNGCIYCLR